ncbi:MAG TPA: ABC transporter ATP-binding protein [Acidimicrobiales bacterium]|nr:ABC transporter ATP-binding protein [Acidimicrobiales bacterium]
MSTTYTDTATEMAPPAGGDAVIALRGVTKRFGTHTVLKNLSFDVPRGRISAVLGPSGTGKSVLLKNIIGLLRPEEGQIYIDGEPIVGIRHKEMLRIRRKFGVLFQDGALFGSMDIFDNIAFPLREHTSRSEREIKALVMEKAEMVGMVAHLKKLPGEISGGMRKRAGLARALILDPEIVFFDEPDSGLDPVRVAYLDELVKSVQRETGCTFFIITHNIDSVKRTADYIGMLYRSSLVRFGPAEEMFVSDRALVKQFLAGSSVGPIGMDEMIDAARGEADVEALLADEGRAPMAAPAPPAPGAGAAPARPRRAPGAEPVTERLPAAEVDGDGDAGRNRGRRDGVDTTARLPKVQQAPPADTGEMDHLDEAELRELEREEALFRQRNGS